MSGLTCGPARERENGDTDGWTAQRSGLTVQQVMERVRPDRKIKILVYSLILFHTQGKELNSGKMIRGLKKSEIFPEEELTRLEQLSCWSPGLDRNGF
jgi:hypothetical protein